MKRQDVLDTIRIKAAKGDEQGAMTAYVEARNVSYQAFLQELRAGRRIREKQKPVTPSGATEGERYKKDRYLVEDDAAAMDAIFGSAGQD